MVTTTYGLAGLAIALGLLLVCWSLIIAKTKWLRGYPDRFWRFSYMILLTTAISMDLTFGLLKANGYPIEHPWCCISIVPLLGAVFIRLTLIKDRKRDDVPM